MPASPSPIGLYLCRGLHHWARRGGPPILTHRLGKDRHGPGNPRFPDGLRSASLHRAKADPGGRDPETPVALIRRGTLPRQETIIGTLKDIAKKAVEAHFGPPAILVVGEVVRLRSNLNWFESKPLFGKRIVVTRTREQASGLSHLLEAEGAEAIPIPVIEILPSSDYQRLDEAILRIPDYNWIIFTSIHGVKYFWERLRAKGKDARDLKGIRLAAIGPTTASELRGHGVEPDLVPAEFRAEAILEDMKGEDLEGKRILLPRAAQARDLLPKELGARGARVCVVEAYRTKKPKADFAGLQRSWTKGKSMW